MTSMERWCGLLKVPLNPKSQTCFRVAASLCLSPSSKALIAPSVNAIFFNGDRVEGTGNPIIEKLSNLQNIASILVSKLGDCVNAWIVEASLYNGPFAVYKEFIPTVNSWGEPASYVPDGFPAISSLQLLLYNCLQEANKVVSSDEKRPSTGRHSTPSGPCPRTILLGFSKGGAVLNQLLSELASYEMQETQHVLVENRILPHSMDDFFKSIVEFHYIDVGLNCPGAYPTDHFVIGKVRNFATLNNNRIRFVVHGTPRQWSDHRRPWIRDEKDKFVCLLRNATNSSNGKLHVCERLYFAEQHPTLEMHFEVIECVNLV